MFRFVLSIILAVAFAGALAASATHGVNHGSDHPSHLAEMAAQDELPDRTETALANCCDTTNTMGSMHCFGDLVATTVTLQIGSANGLASSVLYADLEFSNLTLAVPTGPPKG